MLWAKSDPYHPLWCHLLDVAAVCGELLNRFGPIEPLPNNWVQYLAALHDVGKADPVFQDSVPFLSQPLRDARLPFFRNHIDGFRHEARSADWIVQHLTDEHRWGCRAASLIRRVLCGHHGRFSAEVYDDAEYLSICSRWVEIRNELANMVAEVLGIPETPYSPETFDDMSSIGIKLTGLIVLSDWIASNNDIYYYHTLDTDTLPSAYWERACDMASRTVACLGLYHPESESLNTPRFTDLWPDCETLRPSQEALEESCRNGTVSPGLAIIEAPMGEGKTEAAIYLAEYWSRQTQKSGSYIALPTMATSNQMYERYSEFINRYRPGVRPYLVHGMAWLIDELSSTGQFSVNNSDRVDAREWFRSSKRALIAPEAVGTIDQALMAALNVKFGFLRLLGLSSKVLILDEVHACDEYMSVLLKRLLEWCGALRIPVILLSATLSCKQKRELAQAYREDVELASIENVSYPLLTFIPFNGNPGVVPVDTGSRLHRTVQIRKRPGLLNNPSEIAALAKEVVKDGGCACVLLNTVKTAQKVFQELHNDPEDAQIFLFHSRFRAERRMELEKRIVKLFGSRGRKDRPKKAILVATQVVEQSLDLDFDVMISEIAPIDLLLQRIGRLHRHERGLRPTGESAVFYVLLPNDGEFCFGPIEHVYDEELLLRTYAILQDREAFNLPEDFRELIESCYGDSPVSDQIVPSSIFNEAVQNRRNRIADYINRAGIHLIPSPCRTDFTYADYAHNPVGESEEGERNSYFVAQTRIGDDTCPVLILQAPELIDAVRSNTEPNIETLRRLFLQKVSLPSWWLSNVEPSEGFDTPFSGPGWLRGNRVLPMIDRSWRGMQNNRPFIIRDDELLGLIIEEAEN